MLILGLLLLACTAAFTGLAISDNLSGGPDYDVTVFGQHIATMNSLAIFCAGLALALIFSLGMMMTLTGGALGRRRSRKLRVARRDAAVAARERDELAARLATNDPAPGGAGATPAAETNADYGPGRQEDMAANREAGGLTRDDAAPVAGRARTGKPARRRHARHLFGH